MVTLVTELMAMAPLLTNFVYFGQNHGLLAELLIAL